MPFDSPEIDVFRRQLDVCILAVQKVQLDSHSAIKINSMLNVTIYVMATRFLEGSVKHIVSNCSLMRGDSKTVHNALLLNLKSFNNPEYKNIRELFLNELSFDITSATSTGRHSKRDITFLNEIVRNRHRNVIGVKK